jgi:hypothetical protein
VTIKSEEMADLPPSTRMEIGRCWNAYARWRTLEYEARLAKNEFISRAISLRAAHRLPVRKIAAALGISYSSLVNWTAAYSDPKFNQQQRAKRRKRDKLGKFARPDYRLAGRRAAPESEPSSLRIERTYRSLTDE